MENTDWNAVDYATRLIALHQINDAISRMRVRHGLPTLDDPLPPKLNVFLRVKHRLFPPSPTHERQLPSSVATERTGRNVIAAVQTKSEANE